MAQLHRLILSCCRQLLGIALLASGAPVLAADTLFEFHNTNLDHYFLTVDPAEVAAIDTGAAGPGWLRTGKTIGAYRAADATPAGAHVVCRFYGNQTHGGPNGHFYTADADECAAVNLDPGWVFERNEFFVAVPAQCACPDGGVPVYRNYNGRFAEHDSNHRYTADPAVYAQMIARCWSGEGIAFCGAVSFADGINGIMAGTGRIFRTADGGSTWVDESPAFSGDLYAIGINGIANAWAAGQNGMIFRR